MNEPSKIPLKPAQAAYIRALHDQKVGIEARIQAVVQGIALGHSDKPGGITYTLSDDPHLILHPPEDGP